MNSNVLDWGALLSLSTPWSRLFVGPERAVDTFAFMPIGDGTVHRIIRGVRCGDESRLFQEWAAGLQFPYYFGENWDAFDECMTDLEWLPAAQYVFFITHCDHVLRGNDLDFNVFVRLLKKAAFYWKEKEDEEALGAHSPTPFHVIFHIESYDDEVVMRLRRGGAEI